MTQNHSIDRGMIRLAISEDGPPTYATSRTPPPPGFDGPSANTTSINGSLLQSTTINSTTNNIDRSGTPDTCKSPSFNNLAMALGTGLAECMDDSTSSNFTSEMNQLQKPPNRIHTPDTYTRQSRHSVSRLMGNSASGGVGAGGGFDYLNPRGTSHNLIPPVNSSYLNKLKGGQQQQQQMLQQQQQQQAAGGSGIGSAGGLGNQVGLESGNNNGRLYSSTQQQNQQQGGSAIGNGSSLAQAMAAQNKSVRFTAAMMANAQSGGGSGATSDTTFQLNSNNQAAAAPAGNHEVSSPILSSTNSHHLNQELLRQQLLQQQNNINNGGNQGGNNHFSRANSNPIGVTVVEPSSARNSPAPQRPGPAMISMNGDGLLYPLMQQQQGGSGGGLGQQQLHSMAGATTLSRTASGGNNDINGNNNINSKLLKERDDFLLGAASGSMGLATPSNIYGGRASAPPPQSQPIASPYPGGMTTVVMNNAAIRAYAASSLQMRVAELHQELGGAGGGVSSGGMQMAATGGASMAAAPPGTVMLRTMPAGTTTIPIVLTPAPTPPPPMGAHVVTTMRPPSRGGGGANTSDPLFVSSSQHQPPQTMAMAMPAPSFDPERHERERAAAQELKPFLRDAPSNNSSNSSSSVSTRGLAILYASSLHVPDVRSTCEAFGALESFRSDFGESRGVFFATFYDLRSAQLAVGELPQVLNKLGSSGGCNCGGGEVKSNNGGMVEVKYCVPLNSPSATDESMLMLSNLPGTVDEQDLNHVLSSFGEVRAINYQANMMSEEDANEEGSNNELASYLVEFYDVQDARQALLELEQTNPWGGEKTKVKVGTRSPTKRKQGKDLILLMSCWRQGVVAPMKGGENNSSSRQSPQNPDSVGNTATLTPSPSPPQPVVVQQQQVQQQLLQHQESSSSHQTARTSHVQHHQHQMETNQNNTMGSSPSVATQSYYQQYPNHHQGAVAAPVSQQYQIVVGPDGQHYYALVNHPHHQQMVGHHPYGQMGQMGQVVIDPHHHPHQQQQHVMYAPADQHYQMHNQHVLNMNMNPAQQQQQQYHIQYNGGVMPGTNYHGMPPVGQLVDANQQPPTSFIRLPSSDVNSSSLSSESQSPSGRKTGASTRTGKSGSTASTGGNNSGGHNSEEGPNHNLSLNIDHVRTGKDRRSSLMVRNIPNKYTQQMLLSEFACSGHGPTKMDFFYLPIDFKNKCNRGYAFVNFVDYKDICAFFDEYNGTSWKRFNSDKICDITYARIQGKAAMLKRFENSALMEKDDEYRPKVFVSHGERKGQIESMPMMGSGGSGSAIQ